MRALSLAATAVVLGVLGAGSAQAAGGCGYGFHPGIYGACRPNYYGGPVYRPGFYRPAFYHYGYHWHRRWHRW